MSPRVRSITQKAVITAPPDDVYRALVDPKIHAAFTGAAATGAARVGGAFTAWDGYITGVHRALVPGRKIVQDWSTTEWPAGAGPSTVEITFTRVKGGTQVRLAQTNVPAEQVDSYRQGWVDYYWKPLKAYFSQARG